MPPQQGDKKNFYPRPPRGGRPVKQLGFSYDFKFLSTPSARRATDWADSDVWLYIISIHALREEGDLVAVGDILALDISIHALREEGDP